MSTQLKPGYKQTEVGVIPSSWDVRRLDSLGASGTPSIKAGPFGSSLTKDTYVASGYKVYGQEQVIRGDYLHGDYFIPIAKFKELESCSVKPGDILLSLVGTTGKLLVIPINAPEGIINPRLVRFSFDKKLVFPMFFKELFEASQFQSVLARSAQGGTMGVLNAGMLRPIRVALPPIVEQRAIATALSDVDALINGLDQLIAKKRDLKQAAMQQLLTGQTRLPGFNGKWERVKAGDIGQFRGGSGFPTNVQGATTGKYPFFKVSDMNHVGNEIFMDTSNNYINETLRKQLGATAFPAESIVFAKVGAAVFLERKKILIKESCLDNNMSAFVLDASRAYSRFIHYVLLNIKLGSLVSTTALPSLSKSVLSNITLPLPPLPEQTAIASVLSDMDTDLAALETRRDKTRDLKQGMMQELLTGRIRLI